MLKTSKFAQRLAANDQPSRDRAIKKLKRYIAAKTAKVGGFSDEELLQLWKGLHYCFWMQDKPLLQEELSGKLCGLLQSFPDTSSALKFSAAFFTTQAREWGRLDQWRMNKFMMLIRDYLNATFEVVKKSQWEGSAVQSLAALVGQVMEAEKEDLPDGFRLHLADIYLEELQKVGAGEVNGDHINQLLDPFVQYILHSNRNTIVDNIIQKVFGPIFKAQGSGTSELQFNYKGLQKRLFDAGRQKSNLPKVRRRIYKLVKRFSAKGLEGTPLSASPQQHGALAGKRKRTDEEGGGPERKKKKKKTKTAALEEETEGDQPTDLKPEDQPQSAHKQKKGKEKKDTPQSTPKHVAFDLDRNSSRGLRDFVNSAMCGTSPYLPTRSPSQGILKGSPAATASPFSGTPGEKKGTHLQKRHPQQQHQQQHHQIQQHQQQKQQRRGSGRGQKQTAQTCRLKKSGRGKKASKFAARKKERLVKKPRRR